MPYNSRQIVLDTETTGLSHKKGHRLIEIGCVELINRKLTGNNYHQYINPERAVDEGAYKVHGIGDDFLQDKPVFAQVAEEFVRFIDGAELIIHNAPFDVGFLDFELQRLERKAKPLAERCTITDTLVMARKRHAGQKNNLDALCKRYNVNNAQRDLHGALLDAEILADVYLAMTGGQVSLLLGDNGGDDEAGSYEIQRLSKRIDLPVIVADDTELAAHEEMLSKIDKASQGHCLYSQLS